MKTALRKSHSRTHEGLWLFDEVFNSAVSFLENNDAILGRLSDLGHNDRAFFSMAAVELEQFAQRVRAGHIRVQDNERLAII